MLKFFFYSFSKLVQRKEVHLLESELEWKIVKGGGPGGSKVNKSVNCVQLTHVPTGLQVKCHQSRDLETNKHYAKRYLKQKLDNLVNGDLSKERTEAAKQRAQKLRRQRRSQEKYGHKQGTEAQTDSQDTQQQK